MTETPSSGQRSTKPAHVAFDASPTGRGGVAAVAPPGTPAWYESIFAASAGDATRLPWPATSADAGLVRWLNAVAATCLRTGCRAAVLGCGLGEEVAELSRRGYDTVGFDVSPTAVRIAKSRFADLDCSFIEADWSVLPSVYRHRFDLVITVRGLCWVRPTGLLDAARGLAELVRSQGRVLIVSEGRRVNGDGGGPGEEAADERSESVGPPWPLSADELSVLMARVGLRAEDGVQEFEDIDEPTGRKSYKLRGCFLRA